MLKLIFVVMTEASLLTIDHFLIQNQTTPLTTQTQVGERKENGQKRFRVGGVGGGVGGQGSVGRIEGGGETWFGLVCLFLRQKK